MLLLDNLLLDDHIITQPFLCDLGKCKGACCTVKGGQGAPVLDTEVEALTNAIEITWKYLPERSRKEIEQHGAIDGSDGDLYTRCVDDGDCVFVYYEKGSHIAKCAIEQAYFDGMTSFRKPISCHLFPIRVTDFNGPYLYYEEFPECKPALQNGKRHDVRIFEAVKEALIRAFGDEWYSKLSELARRPQSRTKS